MASLQYAKVAEYQTRGLVHFHALIRLDGPDGAGSRALLDGEQLATLTKRAARAVMFTAPAVDPDDVARSLAWGTQLDVRVVRHGQRTDDSDGPLSPEQVAGYLAKYATKDANSIRDRSAPRSHLIRPGATCRDLGTRARHHDPTGSPYLLLGKWAHMLGFRGHFSTKSRSYSLTLGRLRRARQRFQAFTAQARRDGEPLNLRDLEARLLADDEDTTLVIGAWGYQGTGWTQPGDEALALAAAARARELRPVASRPAAGRSDRAGAGEGQLRGWCTRMSAEMEDRLWSVQDVSAYLGLPVCTVYAWRSAGTGPPGRRMGKRLRYRPQDVRDWVASLSTDVVA